MACSQKWHGSQAFPPCPPHRANQRIGKVWQNPRGKPQVLVFRTFVWRAESFSRGAAKPESNMIQISQSSGVWVSLVAGLGLITSVARAQELKKQAATPANEVKALIDRLRELDRQDTGYSGSVTGSAFLP